MVKKILIASYDTGSANSLSNPILSFLRDEKIKISILCDGPSKNVFKSKSIEYKTPEDYKFKEISLENVYNIIKIERPDLLLTGFSTISLLERYMIYASRTKNITSVSILERYTNCLDLVSENKTEGKFKFMPNYICIMDEIVLNNMIKEGFDKEKLIITGQPYFDDLSRLKDKFSLEDRINVRKDIKIDSEDYLITFFSQARKKYINIDPRENNGYDELIVLHILEDALFDLNIKKLNLLIKLHPEEDIENTKKALKGKLSKVIFDKNYDTRKISLMSNLVTGMFSTCLLEAAYLDKDVISIQPNLIGEDRLITNKLGLSIPVYREKDLKPTLEKMIYDKKLKNELKEKRNKFLLDGKSTERVVNLVRNLLNI